MRATNDVSAIVFAKPATPADAARMPSTPAAGRAHPCRSVRLFVARMIRPRPRGTAGLVGASVSVGPSRPFHYFYEFLILRFIDMCAHVGSRGVAPVMRGGLGVLFAVFSVGAGRRRAHVLRRRPCAVLRASAPLAADDHRIRRAGAPPMPACTCARAQTR